MKVAKRFVLAIPKIVGWTLLALAELSLYGLIFFGLGSLGEGVFSVITGALG